MRKADVVIGSSFGDEGKGRVTDYKVSCSGTDCLVIRFNGGAQAGHTVQAEGLRHIFSHFGSGTLSGAKTYLSRFFVVNPILFLKEYQELKRFNPKVYVDKECIVTTPYDMLLNQSVEDFRGDKKHGSCGLGFNEAIERAQQGCSFRVLDGINVDKLRIIRDNYVPKRLSQLGVTGSKLERFFHEETVFENFLSDLKDFNSLVEIVDSPHFRNGYPIVFEGAQGLLLDEGHKYFPHVTRSKTGLANVVSLAKEMGIDHLNVTYVTRPYVTRHGRGPLPHEVEILPFEIVDETNIENEFQETLRFGWLNLDILEESIKKDLKEASDLNTEVEVAINCLDQLRNKVKLISGGVEKEVYDQEVLINLILSTVGTKKSLLGYGPDRSKMYING